MNSGFCTQSLDKKNKVTGIPKGIAQVESHHIRIISVTGTKLYWAK